LLGGRGGWADQELTRLYALIHDAALDDPHKQCLQDDGGIAPCAPAAFELGVQEVRDFIAKRSAFVKSWLGGQSDRPPAGGPVINSITSGSGRVSVFTPESTATIRGTGFGSDSLAASRPAGRSFVAVEGVRATTVSMSPTEIMIQIPPDLPAGSAAVVVAAGGALSNTVEIPITIR